MFKKAVLSFLFLLVTFLSCSAKEVKTLYVIKNSDVSSVFKYLQENFNDKDVKYCDNTISLDNSYYLKLYSSDENVEMFTYSNNENIQSIIDNLPVKAYKFDDKETFKKYNDDFVSFASSNNFKNVKSIKENKKGYKDYNPYEGKLRNKVIETIEISQNDIKIERKKLKPKAKVKHYAYGYEYVITNNTGEDIIIKNVASSGFIGLTQIAAYAVIPRGLDFVPVYGIFYGVQTDLEKNKFTRPHPTNETIKKGESMKILALSKKEDNPVADFVFIIKNEEVLIKL